MLRIWYIFIGSLLLTGFVNSAKAQQDFLRKAQGKFSGMSMSGGGSDSIGHRTGLEDSITIHFRFLDTSRLQNFDSVLYDFSKRINVPWYHVNLGNLGTASRSLLFEPKMKAGWDHGFHAFDIYNLTVQDARFYNTTRPYAELNYLLGSKSEQLIRLMHTQNLKPNWNMAFEYRLINAPGFFQNQNTNHNNYRFTSWYQSKNKRYQNFIVIVGNKLQSGENGGIKADGNYLDSAGGAYDERSNIPTKLGPDQPGSRNFFSSNIPTGTNYTNATYMLRQQYDLGQKDSLVVNDTTTIPLFYPRLRLEHTIALSTYHYRFHDNYSDTNYYDSLYAIPLRKNRDTFFNREHWRELVNDFSIYTFPDAKNAGQFLKLGASLQTLKGEFIDSVYLKDSSFTKDYYNFFVHGEYRNRTRNKKWDIEALGNFYVNGNNAGDYNAYISLQRLISRQIGYLQVGFQNTNRTPSYVYNPNSSFYLDSAASPIDLKKENTSILFGSFVQPKLRLKLTGKYYVVTNYTYYTNYMHVEQATTLFNVLQVSAEKIFRIGGSWNWKTWVVLQQRIGDGPVNLPLLTTRNQVGYDGTLGFKNLRISFGAEMRYFTSYKAPQYSPLIGQYFYQNETTVKLARPDLSAYLHFRIKSFSAYVRAENLNALNPSQGGFTKNNVPTIDYPYPGMQIRVGIFWSFVN
ncbi:putative porin [Niastella vici]|uniref:putative porin n=1 Tax=Niastella vici TaxID=1703345 RepID=UPI00117F4858|nr:putative porin [Niastella vici]